MGTCLQGTCHIRDLDESLEPATATFEGLIAFHGIAHPDIPHGRGGAGLEVVGLFVTGIGRTTRDFVVVSRFRQVERGGSRDGGFSLMTSAFLDVLAELDLKKPDSRIVRGQTSRGLAGVISTFATAVAY